MEITVLLVDDEKEFVDHMAERLANRGLKVAVAYDGESAVQHVRENPVDVTVLDQRMVGMEGIEALKKITELSPKTKVIMLTGYGSVEEASEAKSLGAIEYLIKPYDTVQLAAMIKDLHGKSE